MKRRHGLSIVIFLCVVIVMFFVSSCGKNVPGPVTSNSGGESGKDYISDEAQYQVWFENRYYHYAVYGKTGETLISGTKWNKPELTAYADGVVAVVQQSGTGASTRSAVFCNTNESLVSKTFSYFLGCTDDLVVFVDAEQNVVMSSIFDSSIYKVFKYEEFENAATDVLDLYLSATFKSDNLLEIQYVSTSHTLAFKTLALDNI